VKLVLIETLVQGERAAGQLLAALKRMEQIDDLDVIVLTRGGGAFEDFLPFSDERLCRAIAACPIPVVSAIGHEKDSPLSDWVADLRVSTPTAAARTVVPDYHQLVAGLERDRVRMRRRILDRFDRTAQLADSLRQRLVARSPAQIVVDRRRFVGSLTARGRSTALARMNQARTTLGRDALALRRASRTLLAAKQSRHNAAWTHARALAPQATLNRGYAIVQRRGADNVISDAASLQAGDGVTIRLARGHADATIDSTTEPTDG
jgi:exodeoxyribonuclease VII large subunit